MVAERSRAQHEAEKHEWLLARLRGADTGWISWVESEFASWLPVEAMLKAYIEGVAALRTGTRWTKPMNTRWMCLIRGKKSKVSGGHSDGFK